MSPAPSSGLQVTTPNDTTVVLTRTFNSPVRLLWAAMFTPDKMRRWMLPPPGWSLANLECDPRVAGALRLAWKGVEGDLVMTLCGVFTEAVLHKRLVHTELMMLSSGEIIGSQVETHEFTEQNGITTMRDTQVYVSKEARDGAVESGAAHGMEICFQQLDTLLAQG